MFDRKPSLQALIERNKRRYDNGKQAFSESPLQLWTRKMMSYTLSPIASGLVAGTLLGQGMLRSSVLLVVLGIIAISLAFVGLRANLRYKLHPIDARFSELIDEMSAIERKSVNDVLTELASRQLTN